MTGTTDEQKPNYPEGSQTQLGGAFPIPYGSGQMTHDDKPTVGRAYPADTTNRIHDGQDWEVVTFVSSDKVLEALTRLTNEIAEMREDLRAIRALLERPTPETAHDETP